MEVRFEDHAGFQRAAGLLALGGAAFGLGGAALTLSALWMPAPEVTLACGGFLGLRLAVLRRNRARLDGTPSPGPRAIAAAVVLVAAAALAGAAALPELASALAAAMPAWTASVLCGALLGLWIALAAAPLHVVAGGDPIETRLAALRVSLAAELRPLAERAAAARRGACAELPPGARADLRGSIDALAAAALELAARCADLERAAPSALREELQRRSAALLAAAEAAEDVAARQSYQRAAEAIGGQLDHLTRVQRARERALARLHEDVATLERARFSLTLLRSPEHAAELTFLQERLQQGAIALEEIDAMAAPVRARV